jgi:hypothetical protein
MQCPDALDLAHTRTGQLGGAQNRLTGGAKGHDALMSREVRCSARILARNLGELDALPLPLAARLIVFARHLQSQFEKQLLHRLQDNPRDAVGPGCKVRQIDEAGNRQPGTLCPDSLVQTGLQPPFPFRFRSSARVGDTPPLALAAPAGVGQGQGVFVSKHSTAIQKRRMADNREQSAC